MQKVKLHSLGAVEDSRLKYAVVPARYQDKWVFVRHRMRDTWEMPAGHHEQGESIGEAASRELFEETGATDYKIAPVCIYSVSDGETETFGQLFFAQIGKLGALPEFEIGEVAFFDTIPEKLTYPLIQPQLFSRVEQFERTKR